MMWVHSFISHFKKIILFAVVVVTVTKVMNYLYVDDTDDFVRYGIHAFYEERENIDRLYLGSSHVYCGVNPVILDGINGENNFNLATSWQQLNTSYYLLKEADKRHHIDRVCLDLYYACVTDGVGNVHDDSEISNSWVVLNQMRPSLNKLVYMLDLSSPQYYYMTFLPFMRYKEELFDQEYIAEIVGRKRSDVWKNYEYRHSSAEGRYVRANGEKGFCIYYGAPDHGRFYTMQEWPTLKKNPITRESLEYLRKIVEYCEQHDIALTWIGVPSSDFLLLLNGRYDNFFNQVTELSRQYDIPYYDFNLCRREYLDVSEMEYWSDMGHLNTYGAEVFTKFLGEFLLSQEMEEGIPADCFYNSYEEKISDMPDEIYGLVITVAEEDKFCMTDIPEDQKEKYISYRIRPVSNAGENSVSFAVSVTTGGDFGEEKKVPVIQDGNDAYITVSTDESGVMNIQAELKTSGEVMNWVGIEY